MMKSDLLEDPGILIVDDQADVRMLLQLSFARAGFATHCADSGAGALALLRRRRFRYLLTDYNMPGMDGLELAEKARELNPDLRIILETGDSSPALHQQAILRGIEQILSKPFTVQMIEELALRWVQHAREPATEIPPP